MDTYFVETYEFDSNTGKCTQMEYYNYEEEDSISETDNIDDILHHTILKLAIF